MMKIGLAAVLCVVLIQGVNCQGSVVSSAMNIIESTLYHYQNGTLMKQAIWYIKDIIDTLVTLLKQFENYLTQFQTPGISQQNAPGAGAATTSAPYAKPTTTKAPGTSMFGGNKLNFPSWQMSPNLGGR